MSSLQEICCCIGMPVAGNPTQYMMETAFQRAGLLDWRFLTFEVSADNFPDAMRGFRVLGFRGGMIILPHEQAVLEFIDDLTEPARLCGAVNCVTRENDRLVGDNTDGRGFLQSLRQATDPAGKRVAILGAGGTARAIAAELALAGAGPIAIVNRTESRGRELVDLLSGETGARAELAVWEGDFAIDPEIDILINATSIGHLDPDAMPPVVLDSLRRELIVADVVFHPAQTRLVDAAADRGCVTLDGLGMLVNQGVIAFQNWTGVEPDALAMREAVEEFLSV